MKVRTKAPFTIKYMEFPELLFGTSEKGLIYFDATTYIAEKGDSKKHSAIDFARKFSFWFESVKDIYEIPDYEIMVTDEATGHVLIDQSLALLFVGYIDPAFGVYMTERMSELFLDGVTLSDTRIVQAIRNRLTKDELLTLIDE